MLRRPVETGQEGEAVRFCGLYGDMDGVAMTSSGVVRCRGRVESVVLACQLRDLHVMTV